MGVQVGSVGFAMMHVLANGNKILACIGRYTLSAPIDVSQKWCVPCKVHAVRHGIAAGSDRGLGGQQQRQRVRLRTLHDAAQHPARFRRLPSR